MKSPTIRSTEYVYRKEDGSTAYKIVRSDKKDGTKDFGQWHFDGKKWISGISGIPRVPYMLPELIKVRSNYGLIVKVEGEKCADRLNKATKGTKYNIIATCNNGGAGNWTDEQSVYLKNARVCILPDNDEAGERDVLTFCKRLKGVASSIKVVRLPGLGPKEDIYDWLEAGHILEELRILYHDAPEYEHPADAPVVKAPTHKPITFTGDRPEWVTKRLNECADNLAKEGAQRNIVLNAVAYRLGRVAAHGLLTRDEVYNALEGACDSNGYFSDNTRRSFENTFDSGFNKGLTNPCNLYENTKRPKTAESFTTEQTWICVPTIVRGLFNAYVYPTTANVMELIIEGVHAGLIEADQWITVGDLQKVSDTLGRGLSETTIRRGLERGANPLGAQFLAILIDYRSIPSKNDAGGGDQIPNRIARNPLGGRPTEQYKVIPIEQILRNIVDHVMAPLIEKAFPIDSDVVAPIMEEFIDDLLKDDVESTVDDLIDRYGKVIKAQRGYAQAIKEVRRQHQKIMRLIANPVFAPIPKGMTYKNSSEYQTACARALIEHAGGETQYGTADLLLYIGCSFSNLKTVLSRAKIEMLKGQFVDMESTIEEIDALPLSWNNEVKGFPIAVMSSKREAAFDIESRRLMAYCKSEVERGAKLSIRYRQAHKQRIVADRPAPEPKEEVKPTEPEVVDEPRLVDAPTKGKREPKLKKVKETYAQAYQRKLVNLVAKSKNIPIEREGDLIINKKTGDIQLTLDFLLDRQTDADRTAPIRVAQVTPQVEAISTQDTADIVAWMVSALGGTVSAVHDRGTPEYQLHAGT